ncbi:MAG: hypothetical protein K2J82_07440 [Muribaculaceae bacterium]|nr:hypothetical protein [Muribaculaceae bacterium]
MAKKSYSASERRGILVVAALALLITSSGFIISRCTQPDATEKLPQDKIQTIVSLDSVRNQKSGIDNKELNPTDSTKKNAKRGKRKKSGSRHSKDRKTYRKRSPLDEPI